MIFKTTDKGGLSIFGKDTSEWSNDINITLNKIDEAGNKISTKISEVKTKIAEKNNKRELNKQWSYDKLIPKEEASPLNETNYNLAESYKQEYDLRQKQIAQEQEYQSLLENETTSTDAAIKLSQRRINQYDNEVSAFDNLNNSYLKNQEEQALVQKSAQEKASQNYISNLYNKQEKKNQDYISAIQTEINTSQKVQKQLENISSDTLETLGYKPKSYLNEIRAEQAEVQKQLKNIETASIESLIPKKVEVPKQASSLEQLRKEQSDFWNQVTTIETSSVDIIKNSTVELSREFVQEADGQIQLKVTTEQYTNSLQQQNLANQNKLNLIQEENGQMALNLVGVEQQTEKTKAQTSAINALIEAKNKALLTNVSEKFNSMGVDVGEMVTVEQLKELKNSSDAATSSLAKMTLEEIGLGESAKKASIGLKALRMAGNMIVSFAITELLSLTVKWLNELAHAEEKAKEKLEAARNELKQASSDVETANTKLDNINESISKINEKGTLSLTDQEDLDRLKKEKEELERILENYKQKEKYAKKDEEDAAVKTLSDSKYTSKNDMYSYETDQDGNMKQTNNGLVSYNSIIDYFNALKQQAEEQQKYLDWMNENHPEWSGTIIDKVKNSLAATKEEMASILSNINDTSNSLYGVTDKGNNLKNTISDMNLQYEAFRYKIGETSFDSLTASAKKLVAALRLDNNEDKDDILNYLNSLSEDDFSKLVTSGVTFDQNTTLESLKDALQKAQNKANNSPINVKINTLSEDLDSSLTKKNDLDSLYSTYEKKDGDELNLGFTDDEVASMLKEHPEYIEYLTKVGDTYKLNEHAMEQWTKANEEQNKSVQNMLGSYESMKNYSTLLNNIKAPSSHGIDEKGNIRSGLGDTKVTKLESSDLDGLLDISNELNNSLAEGVINAKEYFDGISESITSSGLEQALKNVNLQFNETTDYIEEATAAISGELSDALLQSNKQFVLGQSTMSDYVGELKSGVSAEKKLIAATYNLEETEDERGELATQAMGATNDATQKAIDSYNQLNKAEQDLDAVSPLITSLSDNADFLANYVDSYGTLMDSIMDDTQFTDYVSSLSQALVDFANSSTENLYAVQDALVQNAYVSAAQAADLVSQGSDAIAENIGGSLDAVEGLTTFSMGEVGSSIQNASTSIGNVLSALGDALSSFDYSIKAEPYINTSNMGLTYDEHGLPNGINLPSFGFNIHGEGGSSISNLSASLSSAGSYFSNSGKEQLKARAMDINSYRSKGNSSFTRPSVARPSTIETMNDSSGSSGSGSDSSSEPSPQDFNWVESLLSKISKAYDRLKNKVSDTTRTWLNRNNALSDSMETLLSEINAQSDAYDFYMDRFNSYDLSDYYKDLIANGSFNIETVYDDDLKDAISDCQDLYDKAQDAADSVQSLNIEIRQLAKSRFDNIQSQFEEVLGKVNSIKDLYSKDNDLLEEQGWFASTLLNNSMMEQEQKNLEKLEQERDALTKALNSAMASGKIEAESEDWYSMQSAIDDCTSSIFDAKKALVEYDNAIRQINWDAFDRTRDDVNNLIDETEFLVGLLKDKGITDDNGNMNDNGKAAQALIAQKYQLYLNQAKAYKDEILKIDEELSKDPYDKELLDRKQELIKAQQDAINSSISEKDALKDLVQEGYDTFLDKLDEVIQKYKDLMSQQKDAYDYEKSIAEKTKALNALEKQYSAVQGDNSEEGKKNIQQLKDQINTAKDDLKDTEYEKLISDTQAILDNLADTTKTWLDGRLDSFDITMQEIIDQSNENASNISQTITSTAENYGYKLSESMSSIWSTNANNITNGINSVLGDFSNKFVEGNNAINKVCGDINAAVQGLLKNSNDEAQRVADEIARQQAEQNANTDGGYSDGGGSSGGGDDWSDNWDNSDSGSSDDSGSDGVNWIYEEDSYPKDLLDIENSIVDRLKYNSIASSFGARAGYYEQITGDSDYYGTADQNILLLDYLKSHGLKKGSKSAHGGLTLTDEDGLGSEVIVTKYGTLRQLEAGDTVFSKEQVQKLWDMSKGITALTPNMGLNNIATKLPDIPANSRSMSNKVDVEFGDVTLSLPNVKNYEDFMKQMVSDKRFLKAVQEGTLGQVLGRNSLNMLTFR